jgi:cbb3-type cytochrome oxidase maturation protein
MSVLPFLILAGGLVASGFVAAFVWAVRAGQFDDTSTPAVRVLLDDAGPVKTTTQPPR